ncbi:Retrotransposable element Tf2 protein type 1 [Gossypium australe]|uniref:Retrotransposable element Tf2 protein type 1 n=1 Tax=Gossypium australe TaxID=47621 RepID=A0A5B6WS24_9ROSI|nr:Retrotransposable element Tf2 protein type 1 [Gossypium australe]
MPKCCVLEFEGIWEKYLPLVEFAYNNSFQTSIKMAPYEALYCRKCRTPLYWTELSETDSRVSPWKKIFRFDCKGKLNPPFIGPYDIIERIGPVAYRLAIPSELEKIHNVFHASILRRYKSDPSHVISPSEIEIQPDMTYNEKLIRILAPLVKVLWQWHGVEEATWEPEEPIRKQYPNLFIGKIFGDENP